MRAVLLDAIRCIGAGIRSNGRHQEEAELARTWVETRDRRWPFSFERICEALHLDAGKLRRRLRDDASGVARALAGERPVKQRVEAPVQDAIVRMIRAGDLPRLIAATFGVSTQMVSRLACKHARELQAERDAEVCRLRRKGWTLSALAARYGVSRTCIVRICKGHAAGGEQVAPVAPDRLPDTVVVADEAGACSLV